MKKLLSVTIIVLFSFDMFLPLCTVICGAFGYDFSLFSYTFFAVAICLISVFAAVLSFFCSDKPKPIGAVFSVFASLLPVLTVINCIFSFLKSSSEEFFVIGVAMLVALLCAVICTLKAGNPVILNALSVAASLITVIPIGVMGFFMFIMNDFGHTTVVDTIPAPGGERWVEVVDVDSGALGGETVVRVCEDKGIDAFIIKTEKQPTTIYAGEWMEYTELDIAWKDENCVTINSKEYAVD